MLDYSLYHKTSLVNTKKGVFTRGQYEFRSVEEVAKQDPGYLVWLCTSSNIDGESIAYVLNFVDQHPDYFEGVKL